MTTYDKLSSTDQQKLLKFPVYISLLAANADGTTDDQEKNTAIAFEHTKTYTADPVLGDFYKRSEELFEQNWKELDKSLPKSKTERDKNLKDFLSDADNILLKLGKIYKTVMHKSMRAFKNHVSRAHHNILEDFIFPTLLKV
ncbi:hypothetical protein ACFQZI_07205 [Mucilaginibacter lutimaris]|uniref:Uncharacterized protein n=1 Tax=Mucilaginibacter lutimaris TaxID=931629 RepID=A0ABW2ZEL1_9SPHI